MAAHRNLQGRRCPRHGSLIFAETTSIGIRKARMERTILPRRKEKVMIPFGEVEVKICGPEGARSATRNTKALPKSAAKPESPTPKPIRWP